ncbi:MAG: hypothetical protein DHS20C16_14790 [Phycisphaerae bacterium]|nr:MAG: hypothetical protein DHS20C16_14790 [Phycisphaerae bacterium]
MDLRSTFKPSEIAYEWAAFRLGVGSQTVKNSASKASEKDRAGGTRTIQQRWLASQFLDLCSPSILPHRFTIQKVILSSLKQSGYPPLMLYYLIRVDQNLRFDLAEQTATDEELLLHCNAVCSVSGNSP